LVLPPEVASHLGLRPGTSVTLDQEPNSVRLRRPVEQLARVYVEPTTRCRPACVGCAASPELSGDMSEDMDEEVFDRLLQGLSALDPVPTILFGGSGEPLAHPCIVEMVTRVKALGAADVALITGGHLLSEETSQRLIDAGLDTVWVRLDGIRPESYDDPRLGALLPEVLENLRVFKEARLERQLAHFSREDRRQLETGVSGYYDIWSLPKRATSLGVVFVATTRNIGDLSPLITKTYNLGARRFIVSNALPHSGGLAGESLYRDSLQISPFPTLWDERVRLPPMDINELTRAPLRAAVQTCQRELADADASNVTRRCPFVEAGATAVSGKGDIAPCLSLMHGHDEIIDGRRRQVEARAFGNLTDISLNESWSDPGYVAFRRRVQAFDFAPEENGTACSDCLWSRGIIQCP